MGTKPGTRPGTSSVDVRDVLGVAAGTAPAVGARSIALRTGMWDPEREPGARGAALPMLLADGALLRIVWLRGREAADLLGPGDLLAPEADDDLFKIRYRALTHCHVALLDDRVQGAAAADPALGRALYEAAIRRASVLSTQVVLAQLVAIEDRLRLLFPILAECWGRVTGDGIVLPGFLSHTVLSTLVGVRRPSLTAAIGRLVETGEVQRLPDRRWLLAPALAAVA